MLLLMDKSDTCNVCSHSLKLFLFICFKCEECTYKVNFLGVLKNHNNCIHESKCWILPKASFGFSKILTVNYAHGILIRGKDEEPCVLNTNFLNLKDSQRQVLVFICFECLVCNNIFNSLGDLKNHIYCNHASKFELFQRQVLAIKMMLHVNFALVLSEMVTEWRIIFATYMHLNKCFKCKVCINKSNTIL